MDDKCEAVQMLLHTTKSECKGIFGKLTVHYLFINLRSKEHKSIEKCLKNPKETKNLDL